MPRVPIDYSKAVIYKLQHKEHSHLMYVGSTTNFRLRKNCHKCECSNPTQKNFNLLKNKTIRENGGWEMFNMIQIKEFPCENSRELHKEEDRISRELKPSMNLLRAFIAEEERKIVRCESVKKYYKTHKEIVLEKHKIYVKEHRDKINEDARNRRANNPEKHKAYVDARRDKINEDARKRRANNPEQFKKKDKETYLKNLDKTKEIRSIQHVCECGGCFKAQHKTTHLRTKKHLNFIASN